MFREYCADDFVCVSVQHVSDHKTHFKWLAGVELVESVPKNPSGKLLRRVLREQAKALMASGKLTITSPNAEKKRRPAPAGMREVVTANGGEPQARARL